MNFAPRIAPPIGANPKSDIYNAAAPMPGQAYAFPDEPTTPEAQRPSMSYDPDSQMTPGKLSRRDSGHTSLTSSIVTSDSRLPDGQRRLSEGQSRFSFVPPQYHRLTLR